MLTRRSIPFLRTTVFAGLFLAVLNVLPSAAQGQRAFALANNSLIFFETDNPAGASAPIPITGVTAGQTLVGIDIRPQNGLLYGLGVNHSADTMSLYLISKTTGLATVVGAGGFAGAGNLPDPALARYGLDFNPAADRLRVTTNQSGAGPAIPGLNFRINPNTGTLVQADTDINPVPISIDEVAYTNNFQNTSMTALYSVSSAQDTLYIQNPPNNGTQVMVAALSQDLTAVHGFDFHSSTFGFALVTTASGTGLVQIDLITGEVSTLLPFPVSVTNIRGLAVQPGSPGGLPAITLTSDGLNLVRFNTATPGTTTTAVINPAGIVAGDVLVALDMRPQTGQCYVLGFNAVNNTVQLYLLDPQTNVGGTAAAVTAIGGPIVLTLVGASAFGFDFNPSADRIRVVTNADENFRINPNTGALAGADTAINPPGSVVSAAAYTNNFGQDITLSLPTTLYTLDATNDALAIQNTPNGGTQTVSVPVTLNGAPLDFTAVNAFDIPSTISVATANAGAVGRAYAVLTVGGLTSLYGIELSTGVATLIAAAGAGVTPLAGLAVGDGPPLPTTTTLMSSANPSVVNLPVTFTATVAPSTATGTVAFTIDGLPISGCNAQSVSAGIATCATTFTSTGSFQIVATYSGDAALAGSASAPLMQTVTLIPTTTGVGVDPNTAPAGEPVTLSAAILPDTATGSVTFLVDGVPVGAAALSAGLAMLVTSSTPLGTHEVTACYGGDATFAPSCSAVGATLTITQPLPVTLKQYFAEGATGFFQTDIGILNASKTEAADVVVTLFPDNGTPVELLFTLEPLRRRSVDVNSVVAAPQAVSTLVESTKPVAAMRQMTWGDPVYGSTLESGIPDTATSWYFAEGATTIFDLFYLVGNPGATPANVTLTHLIEGGGAPVTQVAVVPAFSRSTFWINTVSGLDDAALSTVVTSDVPIVSERAMYLNTSSQLFEGGTAGRGAKTPSGTWSFAEGATGFFDLYLLFGNPNINAADVTVDYQLPDGTVITKAYPVPGQSRRTVWVNIEDALLANTAVATRISSTLPIVAERAMWWGGTPYTEGSVALGSTETGTVWAVAEGVAGGSNAESTFVLVANGSATEGSVRFTIVYNDGTRDEKTYTLLGSARFTVNIGEEFPAANGQAFSVLVESLTPGVPITVEAARYQSPLAFGDGGGAALATKIQ